jgi:RNA polymerase sigma factor (sigma-70 family)
MQLTMEQIKENTFLKEKGRLLGFIRNRVSTLEEAEDILQDVFYQFVAGFDGIESLDRVTSWLYSVARNKIIDRYRRDSARPKQTDFEIGAGLDEITDALAELPTDQRDIFILNEIEEKSFREIAESTGVSINTLLSRKRYAIMALRKRLQNFYNEILTK